MTNQKQDNSLKRSFQKSINLLVITGVCCDKCEFKKPRRTKRLYARTRLKTRTKTGAVAYLDIFGFGTIAKQMNLICSIGTMIYVEATLNNKRYVDKKGRAKAKMYFMANYIERLIIGKQDEQQLPEDIIEIIDELDPSTWITDSLDEQMKGK